MSFDTPDVYYNPKTPDVYYNPKKFGLRILGEAEVEPDYSFDKFVVWQDVRGDLYWGTDSGCSCPSPFEAFTSRESLNRGPVLGCVAALSAWTAERSNSYGSVLGVDELRAKLVAL